jgi:hypothetical protein
MATIKIAEDAYWNKLQYTHLKTADAITLGSGASNSSLASATDAHVVITPTTAAAHVNVGVSVAIPSSGDGLLIPFGTSYTTIIRKGEDIAVSAECQICPLGEE